MDSKIKKHFRELNTFYLIILGSMSIAAILSVYMVFKIGAVQIFDMNSVDLTKAIVIIALIVGIPVSHLFYHKKIKHINESLNLNQKLTMFRVAFIVRIAMLEGIGLLTMIAYLITADKSFLYMFGVVFILFIIHAPTKQRICSDLKLSEEEESLLH